MTAPTLEIATSDAALLRDVLFTGRAKDAGGAEKVALPRAVVDVGGARAVRFELLDESALGRPSSIAVWVRAARVVSLTATFTPCLAVLLYGVLLGPSHGFALRPFVAACAGLGALVLQLSVNLWNDVEDYARLIDMPGTYGGAGILQVGWLRARSVKRVAVACLVLGLALGVPALVRAPVPLLVIGVLAAVGTMGYSGTPFGFKYRALGDVTVLALCGPGLTLGFAYAAFGHVDAGVVALGFFFGLAAVAILHVNNWQDAEVDARSGALTVARVLGPSASKVYLVLLYAGALAGWGWAWFRAPVALHIAALVAPLLAVAPVVKMIASIVLAEDPHDASLALIRVRAAQMHLLLGVALCIGLGAAVALR
jgi:1,4-dihydroxy-2-naphthoate octaprenyltransferase